MVFRLLLCFVTAPILLLLTVASASAQRYVTSPRGYLTKEGNAAQPVLRGGFRTQVIDDTQRGTARVFRGIAWRRDGNGGGFLSQAATLSLVVTMGHGDLSRVSLETANNFRGASTIVFNGTINRPDWRTPPTIPPAAFDTVVKFQRPFTYTGKSALVWQVDTLSLQSGSPFGDAVDSLYIARAYGTRFGSGCSSAGAGYNHDLYLENDGAAPLPNGMRVVTSGYNAPSAAATLLLLGTQAANIRVPGLCAPVYVVPLVVLVHDATSSIGVLAPVSFSIPHLRALEGVTLVTQLVSHDPSQPGLALRVSNGSVARMPRPSRVTANPFAVVSRYQAIASGGLGFGGSVIARLEY